MILPREYMKTSISHSTSIPNFNEMNEVSFQIDDQTLAPTNYNIPEDYFDFGLDFLHQFNFSSIAIANSISNPFIQTQNVLRFDKNQNFPFFFQNRSQKPFVVQNLNQENQSREEKEMNELQEEIKSYFSSQNEKEIEEIEMKNIFEDPATNLFENETNSEIPKEEETQKITKNQEMKKNESNVYQDATCSFCETAQTSQWRRPPKWFDGEISGKWICNRCYSRLLHEHRSETSRKKRIKKRKTKAKQEKQEKRTKKTQKNNREKQVKRIKKENQNQNQNEKEKENENENQIENEKENQNQIKKTQLKKNANFSSQKRITRSQKKIKTKLFEKPQIIFIQKDSELDPLSLKLKQSVVEIITENGGTVFDQQEIPNVDSTRSTIYLTINEPTLFLNKAPNYQLLLLLILQVPVISYKWIIDSVKSKTLLPQEMYHIFDSKKFTSFKISSVFQKKFRIFGNDIFLRFWNFVIPKLGGFISNNLDNSDVVLYDSPNFPIENQSNFLTKENYLSDFQLVLELQDLFVSKKTQIGF
ncbi:hsp20-like chaperones superfamily protein [Anaeramoeba ignava]|uniref:Hsp20-like chaperones superfamily protein n=1 Tax=Anaeramoeba ignava TaxID=1746090 RepID=A0A9Q0RC92_ANAIG|nr:hsp20-like chaperones superfamily protein [Anaeramoeba ignava]